MMGKIIQNFILATKLKKNILLYLKNANIFAVKEGN